MFKAPLMNIQVRKMWTPLTFAILAKNKQKTLIRIFHDFIIQNMMTALSLLGQLFL